MRSAAKLMFIVLGLMASSAAARAEAISRGANGPLETYTYDGFGRVNTQQGGGADDSVQVNWEPGGERLDSIVGRGMVERHCYDDRGYLAAVFNVPGASAECDTEPSTVPGAMSFLYQYDGRGNKVQELYGDTDGQETTRYGYDSADRLTSSSVAGPSGSGRATSYTVNAEGLRTARTQDPQGK